MAPKQRAELDANTVPPVTSRNITQIGAEAIRQQVKEPASQQASGLVTVGYRVPADIARRMRVWAVNNDRSIQDAAAQALREFLERVGG